MNPLMQGLEMWIASGFIEFEPIEHTAWFSFPGTHVEDAQLLKCARSRLLFFYGLDKSPSQSLLLIRTDPV